MIFIANFKHVKQNSASHTKYVRGETQNMNLKELRTQLNLTQAALAKELGVTSNTISAIEGGQLKLSDKLSAKINEVYGGAEAAAIAEAEKAFEAEAKAAVAEMEAFAAEVEKAVATEEKAEKKKARAAKKKAEAEAEQIADTVSAFVAEVVEPEAEKEKACATKKKVEAEKVAAAAAIPETEKKPEKKTRKVKAKARADKPTAEMVAEAVVETAEAAAAPVEAAVAEKKSRKKAPTKKAPAKKKALAPKKTQTAPKAPVVILQSPFGGEITAEEILSKVGSVDTVYVRIDQNKAYWVKGEENGEVDLW